MAPTSRESDSEEEPDERPPKLPKRRTIRAELFSACATGDRIKVRSLLENGVSPTAEINGVSPFDIAVFYDHSTCTKEILSFQLAELFPHHDRVLLRNVAARSSSIEDASARVLDSEGATNVDPGSPHVLWPRPPQFVTLNASDVQEMQRKQAEIEEKRKQALVLAAAKAREKEERRQIMQTAQLRTRIALEKIEQGDFEEIEPLWALQPAAYVLNTSERDAAGKVLLELARSDLPDVDRRAHFLLTIGANRTLKDASGCTVLDYAAKAPDDKFAVAVTEYIASAKRSLRNRLRRVFIVAFRFHEILQEVALRPGYSGYKRCRQHFEERAAAYDCL